MTILKSKAFWGFATASGGIGCAVAYDRIEAKRIRDDFIREAEVFGKEPLSANESPRCLSFFLISPTAEHRRSCIATLRTYALDILTVAGVDYKWVLLIDAEEGKTKWDEAAREANQPELMIEEGKPTLETGQIAQNLLRSILNTSTDSFTDNPCWKALREKYASVPFVDASEGFVCFDPNTLSHLQSELETVKSTNLSSSSSPAVKPKSSWWKRSTPIPTSPIKSPLNPENVELYFVPCELSQSPMARLQRFLFGQREVTRLIGESVLKIIKQQNQQREQREQ